MHIIHCDIVIIGRDCMGLKTLGDAAGGKHSFQTRPKWIIAKFPLSNSASIKSVFSTSWAFF